MPRLAAFRQATDLVGIERHSERAKFVEMRYWRRTK